MLECGGVNWRSRAWGDLCDNCKDSLLDFIELLIVAKLLLIPVFGRGAQCVGN